MRKRQKRREIRNKNRGLRHERGKKREKENRKDREKGRGRKIIGRKAEGERTGEIGRKITWKIEGKGQVVVITKE